MRGEDSAPAEGSELRCRSLPPPSESESDVGSGEDISGEWYNGIDQMDFTTKKKPNVFNDFARKWAM